MIMLIDSREGLPLDFNHEFITGIKVQKLEVGDYCCLYTDGTIPNIIFERKSIGDLFGTMGNGYDRFKREIIRAKELNIKLIIIIEASLSKVLKGYEPSQLKGISIVKKLFTLWVRYDLTPVFVKDREEASKFITEYYLALGRNTFRKVVKDKVDKAVV